MQSIGDGRRILSFDGGASRCLSQLRILANMMHRIQYDRDRTRVDNPIKPCDYFDLMGGSGTGGLIVILLVRLRLSIADATLEFEIICDRVYSHPEYTREQRSSELQTCMEELLVRRRFALNALLCDYSEEEEVLCDGVILASYATTYQTIKLRTYQTRSSLPTPITILQALQITCSVPSLFLPITLGTYPMHEEFISAEMGMSNPIREVIEESMLLFGDHARVAALVSLGSGHLGVYDLGSMRFDMEGMVGDDQWEQERLLEKNRMELLARVAEDSESTAREMETLLGSQGCYFRFSVQQGMQRSLNTAQNELNKTLGDYLSYTSVYLNDPEVTRRVDSCITVMEKRTGLATLKDVVGLRNGRGVVKRIPGVVKEFVMREEYWGVVEGLIGDDCTVEGQRIVVLSGEEGTGKTQLVARLVEEYRDRYQHILFLDGSSESSISADLIANVRLLTRPSTTTTSPKQLTPTHIYLSNPTHSISIQDAMDFLSLPTHAWLLIIDNLGSMDIPLAHYLPSCDHGHVVLTTRERGWAAMADQWVELDQMGEQEAAEVLLRTAKLQRTPIHRAWVGAMVGQMDCVPIKLVEAGRWMANANKDGELFTRLVESKGREMEMLREKAPEPIRELLRALTLMPLQGCGAPTSLNDTDVSISDIDDGTDNVVKSGPVDVGAKLVDDLMRRTPVRSSSLESTTSTIVPTYSVGDLPSYEEATFGEGEEMKDTPPEIGVGVGSATGFRSLWIYVLLLSLFALVSVHFLW